MAEGEIRIADMTASSGLTNDDNFVVDKAGSNGTKKFSAADYIANKAELVDIRVGADGTTYASAGNAVRGQYNKLLDNINNIGVENITKESFGYHIAMDTTESGVQNAKFMFNNFKKSYPSGSEVKVVLTFNVHSFNKWCYLTLRLQGSSYQDKNLYTVENGISLNTDIVVTMTYTSTVAFNKMVLYFQNSGLKLDTELKSFEIYIDGEFVDAPLTMSDIPSYSTVTFAPKGNLATKNYVGENYAKGVSDIDTGKLLLPNYYMVCPDLDSKNMYGIDLYVDYMTYDSKTTFDNRNDHVTIYPPLSQDTDVKTNTKTLDFLQDNTGKAQSQNINIISVKESVTDKKLKILTIGDSVTAGYGAESKQYWKTLYKHLRINSILNESNIVPVMLGTLSTNYTFTYDNVEYTDLLGYEGYSGKSLKDFYQSNTTPFYDADASGNCKFSINAWLSKYRTMDDSGNRLTMNDNVGTLITSENINSINVCTPDVVIINLGHNDFYQSHTENMQNYFDMYSDIINVIRTQCQNAYIIVCVTMPLIRCFHENLYTNYRIINTNPNSPFYITKYKKNVEYWKSFIETNLDTQILVMPEWNITPTKDAIKWELTSNEDENHYYTLNEFGDAHPYTPAHNVYGYELYAMCQYIKTLMS